MLTPGTNLGLGAVAKGYAVDRMGQVLRARDVPQALVSAGGSSVLALGGRDKGSLVTVRSEAGTKPLRIWLREAGLGTSGSGGQFVLVNGQRHGQVVDPRTGQEPRLVRSRNGRDGRCDHRGCAVGRVRRRRACPRGVLLRAASGRARGVDDERRRRDARMSLDPVPARRWPRAATAQPQDDIPPHRLAEDRRRVPRPSRAERDRAAVRRQARRAGQSPLARPIDVDGRPVGNRFCILPMEGWDGTADGEPSELTIRRWRHFGISGAKLMWGCEAVAVRHDGRANPHQLMLTPRTLPAVVAAARPRSSTRIASGSARPPTRTCCVGLQLTHSGRYARPDVYDRPAPLSATRHPVLDRPLPGRRPRADRRRPPAARRRVRRCREAGARRRVRVRRPEELPRLPRTRAARVAQPSRPLRRLAREPHALHARDHRRHPRRSAGPDDRRPAVGVRHRAVSAGSAAGVGEPEPDDRRRIRVRRADRRRAWTRRSRMRAASSGCSAGSASGRSASPAARRTTTRTCSGRRSFRRSTATSRRRIRCAAWRGRSTRRRVSRRTSRTSRSSAPPTATCRSGCRTWRSAPSAAA